MATAVLAQSTVNAQDGGRIVGGQDAQISNWPSTTALMWGNNQRCGGSLIAPNWVLTAAHCFGSDYPDSVVLGRTNLSSSEGEEISIRQVIIHPDYNSSTSDNDIALIELDTPSTQQPIALINTSDMAKIKAGEAMTVVGWGNLKEGGPSSNLLQKVDVNLIDQKICSDWYDTSNDDITGNQFCAGLEKGGKDSCQGDSGGPIFSTVTKGGGGFWGLRNFKIQTGIVSWGIGCAQEKKPGVYTRISNYLDWINETAQLLPDLKIVPPIFSFVDCSSIIGFAVKNEGASLSPTASIDFFTGLPSAPKIGTFSNNFVYIGPLYPGDAQIIWMQADKSLEGSNFWVDVLVDTDQSIEESNESNNHLDSFISCSK